MIYVVRHGQSLGNVNKIYCGITDVKLSDEGELQATKAGLILKTHHITSIYSSPLQRAHRTAEIISGILNKEVKVAECLHEIDFGIFEGMTWDEIVKTNQEEANRWIDEGMKYRFPRGESYADVISRIATFIDNIDDDSVIITHFGVIQSILIYWEIAGFDNVWDYHISNCDVIVLENKKIDRIMKVN